jgi:hypothetical protein
MMRQRTVIGAVLCTAALLMSGCASGGAGEPTGSAGPGSATGTREPVPQQSGGNLPDAALGGVQPHATEPADALMDSAVSKTEDLMQHLGGNWDFPNGAGPFDPERVRSGSSPQPCTTPAADGQLAEGGLYSVVITSAAPDEPAEETLNRFESALRATGYEALQGNGTGPGDADALANGQSAEGRVTLTRGSSGALALQLRTACSTDPSLQ